MSSMENRGTNLKSKKTKGNTEKMALNVHSMPKTNEKSFKLWFILGGLIFVLIVVLILILI